ncbi:MAG: hypothetical protein GOVbin3393_24 [Prokaryotic dsDNA virus sp.]|nr:MAG: hypothetical protein GOVbin3393_24 [Prokaryotic dsDNA virus sp.]|tara:strand:- start:15977 stop:21847 length:5871 start_codon:yes stop_codon:yes gene_type:complete
MAKKIIHRYVFDAANRTVLINEIIAQKRLLTITNTTANEILYAFPDTVRGASSYNIDTTAKTTTITLDIDTTAMGVYANPTQTGYSGSGTDLQFTIAKNTPTKNYEITVTTTGTGYAVDETIIVAGSQLGGTSANDATVTITSVDGSGAVTGVSIAGKPLLDELQIFIEKDSTEMRPDKTYTDPVSKFRVSQPENLIDTDFEYGLQSTKWETLELIRNIPTFFSRNGDQDLDITEMTTVQDSNQIRVVTSDQHNLVQGNPIIVIGSRNNNANGGFVVTKIVDPTTFVFTAKANIATTGSIKDTYTQVFLASIYQGTEFKLENVNGITTDEGNPSKLTVSTEYPLGLNEGTSFFLVNSVGQKIVNYTAGASNVVHENFVNIGNSTQGNQPTGETGHVWTYGAIDTHNYIPKHAPSEGCITKWFVQGTGANNTITVNTAGGVETITFDDSPHGFTDGQYVVYLHGDGNGAMGGLTDTRPYWVRVIDANTIYLTLQGPTGTGRVNITNYGSFNGHSRSCFTTAFDPVQIYTGSSQEEVRFNSVIPFIANNPNQAFICFYSYVGINSTSYFVNNSDNLASYNQNSSQILFPRNVRVVNNETIMQFSRYPNSGALNMSRSSHGGAVVLMDVNPNANTIWFQNHGLSQGDVVRFGSSSSSVPSGMTRNDYYNVYPVNANRIKFSDYRANGQNNLTSQGATSATMDITGWSAIDGADFIDATQTITPPVATIDYSVSVQNNGSANKFYIDGIESPVLELTEGNTYRFDQSDGSNANHPFKFSETADGTHGGGSEYTTNVAYTGTAGTDGLLTITIASGAPTLYYYCGVHSGMGGQANTPVPTSTTLGHGLTDGDPVVYSNEGNTTIGGLTNAATYYVANASEFKTQLATTATGYTTPDITFRHSTGGSRTTGYIYSYAYVWRNSHGFVTGDRVQYTSNTPVQGLRNGAFYYIRRIDANRFYFYRTLAGAQSGSSWPDRILFALPYSGTGRVRKTTIVDLTSAGAGAQKFTASVDGASDSVYTLNNRVDDTTFELNAGSQIPKRSIPFDPDSSVWIEQDAIRIPDHYLRTGFNVTYKEGSSATGGLTTNTTYYIIRVSQNWIKLAASEDDALTGTAISLTSKGVGQASFDTNNIIGEIGGQGTATLDIDKTTIEGTNTNFTSFFKTGDDISLYKPELFDQKTVNSLGGTTDLNTSTNHGYSTGDLVIFEATSAPTGLTSGFFYYVGVVDANSLKVYPTLDDATNTTNGITFSGTGNGMTVRKITSIGDTVVQRVRAVLSPSKMEVEQAGTETLADVNYSVGTSLILRADGFALHRPYDGGVELIPSTNPDSQMIRQTRKYFRYQSGKGIQVSFAVNFSPTTQIERIEYATGGSQARVYTKFAHRLSAGLEITIKDVNPVNGVDYFNGKFSVTAIYDDYSFHITLPVSPPNTVSTGGFGFYHVNAWQNSELRCGLFDDQNGMFFEYDGQNLKCCRRKSIKQLAGTCTVTFGAGIVTGLNTKFTSQCNVNDYIVLKGQSYQIAKIDSDTVMYITPSYRGQTTDGVVATITETIKVNQSDWNIDTADGFGPTGYVLDLNKIQMAYIDYSWYGAGKIRFGFKDQEGDVQYVHAFIHNNLETEAYMRSGNMPARYDIQNIGTPTYVPALAHWGTSVIMDGTFDDDKAYIFTASSNDVAVTGSATVTVSAKSDYTGYYYSFVQNRLRRIGYCLESNTSTQYNQLTSGQAISGANLSSGTRLRNPQDSRIQPFAPYLPDVFSYQGFNFSTGATRNLIVVDRQPTGTAGTNSNYTVTLSDASTPVVYDIPLISIRLAPSVDTGTIGALGEREIINRMQLLLNSVGILTTHTIEVVLRLNGAIDNASWDAVENPSLSQLIFHGTGDTIEGGVNLFKFRAAGTTGSSGRTQASTEQTLGEVASLGNSIMGGDNTFPDGPDILTVVARLTEDPSTVTASNPLIVNSRISWSESQA